MRNDMSRLALMVGLFVGCLALVVAGSVIALGVPSVIAGPNPYPGGGISVTVDPPAPTESDYIKITVAVEGWLPTPCWDLNWSHTVSGNVVYITIEAVDMTPPGMACVQVVIPGPFNITEEIGQLPAGFYIVQTTVTTPPCYAPFCDDVTSLWVQEVVQATPTPTPPAAVGGIVELAVGGSDAPASAGEGSGSGAPPYAAIAGAAAAALALGAGAWYARRRLAR